MRAILFAIAASAVVGSTAHATILTFDIDNTNPATVIPMTQAYGDNVAALVQGGATYGVGAEGFTPDVVASYAGGSSSASLTRWTTDYGDLNNILENEDDGDSLLAINFHAASGVGVTLYGFDLGGWPNADYVIPTLTVKSGSTTLFSQTNVSVLGAFGPAIRHSVFDFGPAGLVGGQDLSILIDLTGLGGNSDNIGIDNVRFGQSAITPPTGGVPEPATWAMMILGFGLAGATLRRRRAALA